MTGAFMRSSRVSTNARTMPAVLTTRLKPPTFSCRTGGSVAICLSHFFGVLRWRRMKVHTPTTKRYLAVSVAPRARDCLRIGNGLTRQPQSFWKPFFLKKIIPMHRRFSLNIFRTGFFIRFFHFLTPVHLDDFVVAE